MIPMKIRDFFVLNMFGELAYIILKFIIEHPTPFFQSCELRSMWLQN